MANYPAYYTNNQVPNYQPLYGNQYQNFQPPYQQNMIQAQPQMQAPQQQFQQMPTGINGKVVPSVENITANDVPMDGSVAFFPRQDMAEIYAKSWNSDGTIKTVVYKPFIDSPSNLSQNEEKLKIGLSEDITEAFMKRFDELEKRLDDFGLTLTKSSTKSSTSRAKKEADSE